MNISGHTSKAFEKDLGDLHNQVMQMGALAEKQVNDAIKALIKGKRKLGRKVASSDDAIDHYNLKIDEECTRILAIRQPTAVDLRFVIAMSKSIVDLERIGDEAEKIGEYSLALVPVEHDDGYFKPIKHLSSSVALMLTDALNAFARMDAEEALRVSGAIGDINEEFDALMRLLVLKMMEDPRSIKAGLNLMWCARSLVRIGDHVANICEYIVFMVEGRYLRQFDLSADDDE